MVVDLMLGSMDGYAVIREVRRDHDLPIIVVSARAHTHDIVAALEAGADDYVTKPFEVKEITARLRALRRRAGSGAAERARPRPVALDADLAAPAGAQRGPRHGAPRRATQLPLTLTEFRLLCELAASPGPGLQPAGAARAGPGARLLR